MENGPRRRKTVGVHGNRQIASDDDDDDDDEEDDALDEDDEDVGDEIDFNDEEYNHEESAQESALPEDLEFYQALLWAKTRVEAVHE